MPGTLAAWSDVLPWRIDDGMGVLHGRAAVANKMARTMWALTLTGESYRAPKVIGAMAA